MRIFLYWKLQKKCPYNPFIFLLLLYEVAYPNQIYNLFDLEFLFFSLLMFQKCGATKFQFGSVMIIYSIFQMYPPVHYLYLLPLSTLVNKNLHQATKLFKTPCVSTNANSSSERCLVLPMLVL